MSIRVFPFQLLTVNLFFEDSSKYGCPSSFVRGPVAAAALDAPGVDADSAALSFVSEAVVVTGSDFTNADDASVTSLDSDLILSGSAFIFFIGGSTASAILRGDRLLGFRCTGTGVDVEELRKTMRQPRDERSEERRAKFAWLGATVL